MAIISMDSLELTDEIIQDRLDLLLSATQFRARRSGVLGGIKVGDGRLKTIVDFIETIKQYEGELDELKAIAMEESKTIGPLQIKLLGIRDGDIIVETDGAL